MIKVVSGMLLLCILSLPSLAKTEPFFPDFYRRCWGKLGWTVLQ